MRGWLARNFPEAVGGGSDDFAVLFEAMRQPAALLAPDRRVLGVNAALRDLLGPLALLPDPTEVGHLFAPDHRAAVADWIAGGGVEDLPAALFAVAGAPPPPVRCRLRHLDGARALLLLEDLGERARFEERFAEGERLRAVGQLAGGIAHDFNNILSIIVAGAEAARARPPAGAAAASTNEAAAEEALSPLLDAAARGAALVKRLLAFAGRQRLEPRVLLLDDSLLGMPPMLRPLLGPAVRLEIHPDAPGRRVLADPSQLEQVVVNLAVNAGQAMPQGGRLTVASGTHVALREEPGVPDALPAGRWTVLCVSDTGRGMAPDLLGRVFEPFFTTRAAEGGTGLGLATVHGIVRQSGGALQVHSREGQGTRFSVFLPRHDAAAEPEPQPPPPPAADDAPAGAPAAPLRVLLVDDEAPLRRLVERALSREGMQVEAAGDAEDALERLEGGFRPDVLVSDVAMPGTDGITLAGEVRGRLPGLPVVLVSGYAQAALDAAPGGGEATAGMAFLPKPYRTADLAALVRRVAVPGAERAVESSAALVAASVGAHG